VLVLSCACLTISGIVLWPVELTAQAAGESREVVPGLVRKNLGEYPSNVPGFEKVGILEDSVQPGAMVGSVRMLVPMFCTAFKGEATLILDGKEQKILDGKEQKMKTGDSYVYARDKR
jgi:uncharacterized cupin superfamily protein